MRAITVELDDDVADALDGVARRTNRPLGRVIGDVLTDHLLHATARPVNDDRETAVRQPGTADPYLQYLNEFLHEWNSPEDAAAFDDL